jgi:hypothetical protein
MTVAYLVIVAIGVVACYFLRIAVGGVFVACFLGITSSIQWHFFYLFLYVIFIFNII